MAAKRTGLASIWRLVIGDPAIYRVIRQLAHRRIRD
jgi:hypothetical protein